MSFHEDSFHETKRERKFYEDKKQKALRWIDDTIDGHIFSDNSVTVTNWWVSRMKDVRGLVNDI